MSQQQHSFVAKFLNTSIKQTDISKYSPKTQLSNPFPSGQKMQMIRKTPVRQHSTSLKFLCITLVFVYLVFLTIDIRHDIDIQINNNKHQSSQCYRDLIQNQCDQPVEALIQRCKYLQECSRKDPQKSISYTSILMSKLTQSVLVLYQKIGFLGIGLFAFLLLMYQMRPYQYHQQKMIKQ